MPVACQSSMTTPKAFELPAVACESLGDPGLKLVLHCITFSHYCERARWTLRLLGIPYDEVNYLPLLHMPYILGLQRKFKQGPGRPSASSKSPAATPCLAIYSAAGQPLCLLQDSDLICRYAVLRASALQLPYAANLYGSPPLALTPADTGSSSTSSSSSMSGVQQGAKHVVTGGAESIKELEARLGGTMGIEVRRVAYHNLLPVPAAGGGLFINNSSSKLAGHIMYWLSRLLLPRLLGVNAHTAARGEQRLLQEFDYLDSLLLQQQQKHGQQQQQGARDGVRATAAAGEAPAGAGAGGDAGSLPYYLLGPHMTVADIQLACLAGPLLCVPNELSTTWLPQLDLLPPNLRTFVQGLLERPTGKFVMDMWCTHGPLAGNAAADAGTTGAGVSARQAKL